MNWLKKHVGAVLGVLEQSGRVLLAAVGLYMALAVDTPATFHLNATAIAASNGDSIAEPSSEIDSSDQNSTNLIKLMNKLINWVYVIAGFVAVISIIYAAFNMGKDKDMAPVWWTVGSVVVVALAATIVKMILHFNQNL